MVAHNSRQTAARLIAHWLETNDFPDLMLEDVERDRAFVGEVLLGVIRWQRALDYIISKLAPLKPRAEVAACVYVGLYQLLFLDNVEEFAAVHETVEASKTLVDKKVAGFVNALLRRAQRESKALLAALDRQPAAVRLSHPDALFARWRQAYGEPNAIRLCEWNNRAPDTFLRQRATGEFRKLERGRRVSEVEGYAEGEFVVQDPATMLAVDLLDVQPGHSVFDACAAPGGKTIALADRLNGMGSLTAMDVHDDRLALLKENLARAKCANVVVTKGDAANAKFSEKYDRVLLDVPCSNTGVIRRRPDARWRFSEGRLASLCATQRALLENATRALAPGGAIVYSTCSLEPEENERAVASFIKENPEFKLAAEKKSFPPDSGIDGAFAARLVRK